MTWNENKVKMNFLIKFGCITLIIFLQLSSIESRQKSVFVGLPDDQCTEWKEVTEEEYQKALKAPIKHHGQVEEEVQENEKCDLEKPKEDNGNCTCMENLGLIPENADIYKKVDIQRIRKQQKKLHKQSKPHKQHHKTKKDKHATPKNETGSFSEEFDGSEEEPFRLRKHDKHNPKNSGDKTDHKNHETDDGTTGDKKDNAKKNKHKKIKHGKVQSPHTNNAASFSEEFDGSDDEELRKVRKQKPASKDENKAEEVKSDEDDYDDITETVNGNSVSISYADSQE